MVKFVGYFSHHLKRLGPAWHGARFVYCLLTGVVFSDIYHCVRLKRNAEGLRKHGSHYLRQVTDICDKLGIRPILNCGTLLGYAKSGRFETDSKDIDLAVFADELKDPAEFIGHMNAAGFDLRIDGRLTGALAKVGAYYLLQFHHPAKHVSVDICFLYRYNDKVVFLEDRRADYLYRKLLNKKKRPLEPFLGYFRGMPAYLVTELELVEFEGSRVWVPKDPWTQLRCIYGNEIALGKKNIFSNVLLIRENVPSGAFEFIDPSRA